MNRHALTAVAAAVAALLTACPSTPAPPTTIDVRGVLVDSENAPIAGAHVSVAGRDAVLTAADGRFAFDDVTPPYELSAALTAGSTRLTTTFHGVTRTNPRVPFTTVAGRQDKEANVTGRLSGGAGFPAPEGHETRVALLSADLAHTGFVNGDAFTVVPDWGGPRSIVSGQLHALQWATNATTGLPETYTGYATRAVTGVVPGVDVPEQDLHLEPLDASSTGTLVAQFAVPGGLSVTSHSLGIAFDGSQPMPVAFSLGVADRAAYRTPVVPGATAVVTAGASGPAGTSSAVEAGLPTTGKFGLDLLAPAALVAPAAASSAPRTTSFAWTPTSGALHVLTASAPGFSASVVTAGGTAIVPGVAALEPGTELTWTVTTIVGWAGVDEVLTPDAMPSLLPAASYRSATPVARTLTLE